MSLRRIGTHLRLCLTQEYVNMTVDPRTTEPIAPWRLIGALLLVGPKHCKLAWISAIVYLTPFIVGGLVVLFSR